MVSNSKKINIQVLEEISKVLGDSFSNSQISSCFKNLKLSDKGAETTKWKRIFFVLKKYQIKNKTSKDTFRIIEYFFSPVNILNDQDKFQNLRLQLNKILCLEGFTIKDDGKIRKTEKLSDIAEINQRYSSLLEKLKVRKTHKEVLKYCTEELLQENYFHSIFEASKGLLERVRELSGSNKDGSELLNEVFSTKTPILKINELKSDSEKNQQNGFKEILNGVTHYVRNVTAHTPKIKWIIDESAAIEVFNVISFSHSILDNVVR